MCCNIYQPYYYCYNIIVYYVISVINRAELYFRVSKFRFWVLQDG